MARRVVLGERANGNYGLFISKAGSDANSASNENLMFNTQNSGAFSLKTFKYLPLQTMHHLHLPFLVMR